MKSLARPIPASCLRPLRLAATIVLCALALLAAGPPPQAHAGLDSLNPGFTWVSSRPAYKGWGYVLKPTSVGSFSFTNPVPAYRWTGSRWAATSRTEMTEIYVWPWGGGWSWTWTRSAGWLAMEQRFLLISD